MRIGLYNLGYHLENAEMTPELRDRLINFSFDSLQDVVKESKQFDDDWVRFAHDFSTQFLEGLKRLVRYHFYSCVLHIFII